jgi:hypothetical protein
MSTGRLFYWDIRKHRASGRFEASIRGCPFRGCVPGTLGKKASVLDGSTKRPGEHTGRACLGHGYKKASALVWMNG